MGQTKSKRDVNMESSNPLVREKIVINDPWTTSDEIIVFAQKENVVRNRFIWQQEINSLPYNTEGSIFTDRLFNVRTKTGDIIKFSTSLSYDRPLVFFKAKVTEGEDLISYENLKTSFSYSYNESKGYWGSENCSHSTTEFQNGEFVKTSGKVLL